MLQPQYQHQPCRNHPLHHTHPSICAAVALEFYTSLSGYAATFTCGGASPTTAARATLPTTYPTGCASAPACAGGALKLTGVFYQASAATTVMNVVANYPNLTQNAANSNVTVITGAGEFFGLELCMCVEERCQKAVW